MSKPPFKVGDLVSVLDNGKSYLGEVQDIDNTRKWVTVKWLPMFGPVSSSYVPLYGQYSFAGLRAASIHVMLKRGATS